MSVTLINRFKILITANREEVRSPLLGSATTGDEDNPSVLVVLHEKDGSN